MKTLILYLIILFVMPMSACSSDPENVDHSTTEEPPASDAVQPDNNKRMKIKITVNGRIITASMTDNAAARDFISRLPLEVELEDYNRTEKIFYPSPKLNIDGVKR